MDLSALVAQACSAAELVGFSTNASLLKRDVGQLPHWIEQLKSACLRPSRTAPWSQIPNMMRRLRVCSYTAAALMQSLILGVSSASAQTSLRGRVLDAAGERPLANANIKGASAKLSAHSDGAGRFVLPSVPPGPQLICERSANRRMSEILLERIAGIRLVGQVVHSTRDGKLRCPMQVMLNDMTIYNGGAGQKDFDINVINPSDVLGVEY